MCDHLNMITDWARHRVICDDCGEKMDPVWAFSVTMERAEISAPRRYQALRLVRRQVDLVAGPVGSQSRGADVLS